MLDEHVKLMEKAANSSSDVSTSDIADFIVLTGSQFSDVSIATQLPVTVS